MVKYIQTIRREFAKKLSVFDHLVGLAVKGLNYNASKKRYEAFPSLRHNKKAEKN